MYGAATRKRSYSENLTAAFTSGLKRCCGDSQVLMARVSLAGRRRGEKARDNETQQ